MRRVLHGDSFADAIYHLLKESKEKPLNKMLVVLLSIFVLLLLGGLLVFGVIALSNRQNGKDVMIGVISILYVTYFGISFFLRYRFLTNSKI